MNFNKPLYKLDSKGKIRKWFVTVNAKTFTCHHGLKDGKLISKVTTCKAKNVGRSNETTPEQQALLEAEAKWVKRKEREGYSEDINNLEYSEFVQPMLARDYIKLPHQVLWTLESVWGSPKLDGVRAIYIPGKGFQSRKGTFYKVPHLEALIPDAVHHMLDGELYLHNTPLNRIVRAVKKPNDMTPRIQFRIFDVVPDKPWDRPWGYKLRYECAKSIVENINNPLIKLVPNTPILGGPKEVDKHLKNYLDQGYEGLMLRHALSPYVRGQRSPDLFKYKKFKESEYLVQDVEADKDGNGVLVCDGFKVRMKGTDAERRHQIDHPNQYIGKMVTVRYFTLTEFGQPQFPIGITIREDL